MPFSVMDFLTKEPAPTIISSPTVSDEPVNHECILTKHSLAYIMGVDKHSPYVRLRPHSYKQSLFGRPTYDLSNDDKTIHCKPANLISINLDLILFAC